MKNHTYKLKNGITATPEFAKKKLAEFAVNVGLRCGHDCTYCSSQATLRMHKGFHDLGEKPFSTGYSIGDPTTPERVAHEQSGYLSRGWSNFARPSMPGHRKHRNMILDGDVWKQFSPSLGGRSESSRRMRRWSRISTLLPSTVKEFWSALA